MKCLICEGQRNAAQVKTTDTDDLQAIFLSGVSLMSVMVAASTAGIGLAPMCGQCAQWLQQTTTKGLKQLMSEPEKTS